MQEIDISVLAGALRTAPDSPTFIPPSVSPYVMEHIYEPLLRGERVLFSELDFSAFVDGDLDDLEGMVYKSNESYERLQRLGMVFRKAAPVSLTRRTFC